MALRNDAAVDPPEDSARRSLVIHGGIRCLKLLKDRSLSRWLGRTEVPRSMEYIARAIFNGIKKIIILDEVGQEYPR